MPRLTEQDKVLMLSKLEEGWSIRRVATHYGLDKSTVLRVKKRWEQEGTVTRRPCSGRPKISNAEQDGAFLDNLRENPFNTARQAVFETNFPGSWVTACRRVKNSEIINFASAKKNILTEENKQSRIIFCLNYIYRPINFWNTVIFSDEKVFKSCNDGRLRVYRPVNSRFSERYVSPRNKSGRFSVNVWAWISILGPGVAWRIDGRFNAVAYLDILQNVMLPSVEQLYPNDFIFQQDNCPIHTARIITQWYQNNNIEILPWPSCSPDMNPLENVWSLIVKKIYKRNFRPANAEELWEVIQNAWEELSEDQNYWQNLTESMPRRLDAVLEANEAMTKY